MDAYFNDFLTKYFQTSAKLFKCDTVVFKRFAPNVSDVRNDFLSLAAKFEEANAFSYTGMCYLGAAKCEKVLRNSNAEMNFYLKSARAFVKAKNEVEQLGLKVKECGSHEAALSSFNLALTKVNSDSVVKAAIIREIQELAPNFEGTSNFVSSCHRIYELEIAANNNIATGNYLSALGKITDIFDNIKERKMTFLYQETLARLEVSALLLLTVLNFPPSKHSPAHIKIIEKYVVNHDFELGVSECVHYGLPSKVVLALNDLVLAWGDIRQLTEAVDNLYSCASLQTEHRLLLDAIANNIICN